ncbi:hypothetical protein PHLCEN_2v4524 [Hermanssonia centrifuga]|uniref:PhoD-like phosphatase metallophosphatase domain-containing protein n=1 Tax=Hermanssonia centrifuga TaxID=98765 RepID=A0A2R6PNB6_9APHY|nr:hypothetical protein PHLCEN_2v4524 [Hermanssonia centrifuga]
MKVADQSWKAGTADSNDTLVGCSFSASGACFTDRKLAGVRAYHEWMPIRQVDVDDKLRIWRNFQIGKLLDAWDGYRANRNRILDHLYNNEISNTVILSGDSHANWVSDLALTSTSSFGSGILPLQANAKSQTYLTDKLNADLQWSEGSFRGFFTLTIEPHQVNATYWAMQNISANKLSRPVAGGKVAAGVLKTEALAAIDTTTASAD